MARASSPARQRPAFEFEPDRTPGLLGIARLELELGELLGRSVDLRTLGDLSQYFRDEVAAKVRTLYDAA